MNTIETILDSIHKNPGSTSPQICDLNPSLVRATVTSAISKLKKRGAVKIDAKGCLWSTATPKTKIAAAKPKPEPKVKRDTEHFSPEVRVFKKAAVAVASDPNPVTTSVAPNVEPISELKSATSMERILAVLKPFADYAKVLKEKGIKNGHPYVLMSGTTEKAHVVTADGLWFLNAETLFEELSNS